MSGDLFAGLMSGTSLDGVDAVLADFSTSPPRVLGRAYRPYAGALHDELASLSASGPDEIDRAGAAANALSREYALAIAGVLSTAGVPASAVHAIGCHGQTVRHRPERGYTVQIGNAALLAELSGIRVVSDFRSRDIAAGGQGAPLVPAFHAAVFASPAEARAVLNLGGIANLTVLRPGSPVAGFDCGPANGLLDLWASRHLGKRLDEDGRWGASGREDDALLGRLLEEPWFGMPPPKSTGRELFNADWLSRRLSGRELAADVQATLAALTACTIRDALERWCPGTVRLIACGGGTRNPALMARLTAELPGIAVEPSTAHGVEPGDVEALAFAWLAREAVEGRAAGLPSVTGARGARILGAIYPA